MVVYILILIQKLITVLVLLLPTVHIGHLQSGLLVVRSS